MFFLFNFLIAFVLYIPFIAVTAMSGGQGPGVGGLLIILPAVYGLGTIIPYLAVAVRRLHDTNRSGWWYFITFIPCVGPIVLIVFLASPGTSGSNNFGAAPK
jgi:uncharacterized membrane protein YhaH (DUF805 family)